jgi:hypothetical protein
VVTYLVKDNFSFFFSLGLNKWQKTFLNCTFDWTVSFSILFLLKILNKEHIDWVPVTHTCVLGTREAEIRKIAVGGQSGQKK